MATGSRYWQSSWNPFAGCSPVSEECRFCWAERMASTRLASHPAYAGLTRDGKWTGEVRKMPAFDAPPRMRNGVLFCGDMTDLFHESLGIGAMGKVLAKLDSLASGVIPLVLTKRAGSMQQMMAVHEDRRKRTGLHGPSRIWCGVTIGCESSRWRLAELQRTPCAGRWLSLEPMIEPLPGLDLAGIGWVVVGAESGPGARECLPVWIGDIVRQCQIARVPVFVKQVRLGKRVSREMSEWPKALRVRQRPAQWGQR